MLLIDRAPIGADQTSACAAPLPLLERLGVLEAVEQVHHECVFHLPGDTRGHSFPTRHRWATFDYARLCQLLFARGGANFERATVHGLTAGGSVATSLGERRAPVLIDASGWRAVLGRPPGRPAPAPESMGLEARLPSGKDGLHFWVQPAAIRHGYAWDFPAGDHRRAGVITYRDSGGLRGRLQRFLAAVPSGEPSTGASLHGGALPARLRRATAGHVFRVGDSGGQCLPLTGEGIRPALAFGFAAGRLGRRVLCEDLPLSQALRDYRRLVQASWVTFTLLRALQGSLGYVPRALVGPACWLFDRTPVRWVAEELYWAAAPLELATAA